MVNKGDETRQLGSKGNLKKLSSQEAREFGSKGGIASGATRRRQKTFREVFKAILPLPAAPIGDLATAICNLYPQLSLQQAIGLAIAQKAANGDISAAVMIRDTLGEKPKAQLDLEQSKAFEVKIKVVE